MTYVIGIELAGIRLNCCLHYKDSISFFRRFEISPAPEYASVQLDEEDIRLMKRDYPASQQGAVAEIKLLTPLVSDALLPHERLIIHSVALMYEDCVWLLAAPSGTGKTTQFRNLAKLFPGEFRILCGDNPVLHFQKEGKIMVFPSPWNGKENYGSDRIGILGGIIFLEQAKVNLIEELLPVERVLPLFHQMNTFLKTEDQVHQLFELERRLISSVHMWKFRNTGDLASSELLAGHIRQASF